MKRTNWLNSIEQSLVVKKSRRKRRSVRRDLSFDKLEARNLLATISASTVSGALFVNSADGVQDRISVDTVGSNTIQISLGSEDSFTAAEIDGTEVTLAQFEQDFGATFSSSSSFGASNDTLVLDINGELNFNLGDMNDRFDASGLDVNDITIPLFDSENPATNTFALRAFGGGGDDRLIGSNANDILSGDIGSDTISGGEGNDTVLGGEGDDRIDGGLGDDELRGEGGNDTINGGDSIAFGFARLVLIGSDPLVPLVSGPSVSLAKSGGVSGGLNSDFIDVNVTLRYKNTGDVELSNLALFDDIQSQFSDTVLAIRDLAITNFDAGDGTAPSINTGFGIADTTQSLITGGTLQPGAEFTVSFTATIDRPALSGLPATFETSANASATSPAPNPPGGPDVVVTDVSDNGSQPTADVNGDDNGDENGDGIAGNDPTLIQIPAIDPNLEARPEDGVDSIFGGDGNDIAFGGAGDDLIDGGDGDDNLNGDSQGSRLFIENISQAPLGVLILGESEPLPTNVEGLRDRSVVIALGNVRGTSVFDSGSQRLFTYDATMFFGVSDDQPIDSDSIDSFTSIALELPDGLDIAVQAGVDSINLEAVSVSTDGNDTIRGGAGDDFIRGSAGEDTLFGDAGNDTIIGGLGADSLDGGDNDDNLIAYDVFVGIGGELAQFDGGQLFLRGDSAPNQLIGGEGNDSLGGDDGDDNLSGGNGNDSLIGGSGNDLLDGGNGDDFLGSEILIAPADIFSVNDSLGESGDDTLIGGEGDDTLRGSEGEDTLDGGDGNDEIFGGNGDDIINGGLGNDLLFGSSNPLAFLDDDGGSDTLNGDEGNDILIGGAGDDLLNGGDGNDQLGGLSATVLVDGGFITVSEDGDDVLNGGNGVDVLEGGLGNDILNGDAGQDTLGGGDGDDTLDGGLDDDVLSGADGTDVLSGGDGDDDLDGGQGNDTINGDAGDDVLNGGGGDDQVFGGDGNDTITGDGDRGRFILSNLEPIGGQVFAVLVLPTECKPCRQLSEKFAVACKLSHRGNR